RHFREMIQDVALFLGVRHPPDPQLAWGRAGVHLGADALVEDLPVILFDLRVLALEELGDATRDPQDDVPGWPRVGRLALDLERLHPPNGQVTYLSHRSGSKEAIGDVILLINVPLFTLRAAAHVVISDWVNRRPPSTSSTHANWR